MQTLLHEVGPVAMLALQCLPALGPLPQVQSLSVHEMLVSHAPPPLEPDELPDAGGPAEGGAASGAAGGSASAFAPAPASATASCPGAARGASASYGASNCSSSVSEGVPLRLHAVDIIRSPRTIAFFMVVSPALVGVFVR